MQPTLKNPEKYIVTQLIYFHYDINNHSMYPSPYPHPTHNIPKPISQQSPMPQSSVHSQQTPLVPPYYKSSSGTSGRHVEAGKIPSKINRIASSKYYHSTHKPIHTCSETNLIVLQANSPPISLYSSSKHPNEMVNSKPHQPSPSSWSAK